MKTPLAHAREWMQTAQPNLRMAELDLPRVRCFSLTMRDCHETVWAALKALLALDDVRYPPHRRLTELLDLQVRERVAAPLRDAREVLLALHPWAHDVEVPDEEPSEEEAQAGLETARRAYEVARGEVGEESSCAL